MGPFPQETALHSETASASDVLTDTSDRAAATSSFGHPPGSQRSPLPFPSVSFPVSADPSDSPGGDSWSSAINVSWDLTRNGNLPNLLNQKF